MCCKLTESVRSYVDLCLFAERNKHFQFGTVVLCFLFMNILRKAMAETESFSEPYMDHGRDLKLGIKAHREGCALRQEKIMKFSKHSVLFQGT